MEQVKQDLQIVKKSFLSRLIHLAFSKAFIKQGIKFAIVGGIGTLVNLSILYIFTDIIGILYLISGAIAFNVALVNNYILNKMWTFEENIKERIVGKVVKYAIICIIALSVNLLVLFVLVEFFLIYYLFSQVGAIIAAFMINFIGNRFWTFRNNTNNDKIHQEIEVKIKRKLVAFIMASWLLILGLVDVIIGIIKLDIVVLLGISLNIMLYLGILLIIIAIIILIRLIFGKYFNFRN